MGALRQERGIGSLAVMALIEAAAAVVCQPGVQTTDPIILSSMLQVQSTWHVLQSFFELAFTESVFAVKDRCTHEYAFLAKLVCICQACYDLYTIQCTYVVQCLWHRLCSITTVSMQQDSNTDHEIQPPSG